MYTSVCVSVSIHRYASTVHVCDCIKQLLSVWKDCGAIELRPFHPISVAVEGRDPWRLL